MMAKSKKPVPRINQLFALLIAAKGKGAQVTVANDLGISSQSLGYYMRGRKIPVDVIEKWEEVYHQNLMALSKTDFETNLETIVSRETKREQDPRERFDRSIATDVIKREMLEQLYKDLDNQARHLDKALDLVARLLPASNSVQSITTKDR